MRLSTLGAAASFGVGIAAGVATQVWPTKVWLAGSIFWIAVAFLLVNVTWWLFANYRLVWPLKKRESVSDDVAHTPVALLDDSTKAPHPVFGCPRQEAAEPFRCWWHVPITVSESAGQNKIENATVELRWDGHPGPPTLLQWQAHGHRGGVRERTLLEGRNGLVPIALRDEPHVMPTTIFTPGRPERLTARITGTSYLVDGANKFEMPPGRRLFRLAVRSGKSEWLSPHRYLLTIPPEGESNGHFTLQVWHEGKD